MEGDGEAAGEVADDWNENTLSDIGKAALVSVSPVVTVVIVFVGCWVRLARPAPAACIFDFIIELSTSFTGAILFSTFNISSTFF